MQEPGVGPEQHVQRRATTGHLADWLRAHEEADRQMHEAFVRSQRETLAAVASLRSDLEPVIKMYNGATWSGRVTMKFLNFILLVGGVIGALYAGLKFIIPK